MLVHKEPGYRNSFQLIREHSVFQKQQIQIKDAFALHHYKALEKYLMLLGLNPYSKTRGEKIRFNVALYSMIIGVIPMILQLCVAIRDRDIDGIIDELPHVLTMFVSFIKFANISLNKQRFKILLDFIVEDWEVLTNELHVLDKVTKQGRNFANLYRTILLTFLVVFLYIPLLPPTLDIIMPLNDTRPKQQLFGVNYIVMDVHDHFYIVYFHMSWTSILSVLIIVAVDCLYMLVVHHASGLFDVCGYRVEKGSRKHEFNNEEFKKCVVAHHRALQFFDSLQECSQNMNLMLVGMNMIAISLTAIQIILYMDQPMDAMRYVLFLIAEKFHLFIISLNGQILLNHALALTDKIFSSNWYQIPVKYQKLLYTMTIRCNKACMLSAGGLYEMNIENFGKTVKACMSYFTMFLSLRG